MHREEAQPPVASRSAETKHRRHDAAAANPASSPSPFHVKHPAGEKTPPISPPFPPRNKPRTETTSWSQTKSSTNAGKIGQTSQQKGNWVCGERFLPGVNWVCRRRIRELKPHRPGS